MTKSKKLIGLALLACFMLSALIAVGVFGVGTYRAVAAELSNVDNYFGAQLNTTEQKEFYKAMQAMNANEIFIKGEDYDLVAGGHVTQAQLEAYANGDMTLLNAMGAARDAFYTDYDDIFYVDFGYLSLRVTQDTSGKYHAYLGVGRSDTYWTQGFNSEAEVRAAIVEYKTALSKSVTASKAAKPTNSQVKTLGNELAAKVAQIREAHRQVAISTTYRLETEAGDDAGHVRTPYGVFIKGKALCEGYSRAFKAIMDELGVPCVLVNGAYRHGENQEEVHMWTYVKLDGSWYAVDPTFDDLNYDDLVKYPPEKYPRLISRTTPLDDLPNTLGGENKDMEKTVYDDELGYLYSEDYFLKGAAYMNTQHVTSPYKSEAEYPFTYPELSQQNIGGEISLTHGMFKVVQTPYSTNLDSTNIYVSVLIDGEWCGYAEAEAKGYYILVRYEGDYLPEKIKNQQDLSGIGDDEYLFEYGKVKSNSISTLVWAYLNPIREPYPMYPNIQEGEGYTVIQDESKSTGFEFALTTRAPRPYDWDDRWGYTADEAAEMLSYTGDMSIFLARSGLIETQFGDPDYQPAPHIVRATPAMTGRLDIPSNGTRTWSITIEYDQMLQFMDGATELQMSVYGMRATGEIMKGTNAVRFNDCIDVNSIKYDLGEKLPDGSYRCGSVSFKFTPYADWAYDSVMYYFNFNLEGVNSHRQVNPATYAVGHECEALCYKAYGYHWNVFGQPRLMEEEDLSKQGWETADGTDVSQSKDRFALVVTKPSQKQDKLMMDMVEDTFDEDILESFTYNITLTICKSVVLETGQGVRVCVGFPEGFTYNDSMNGVTFKAYHFIRDKRDQVVDVEEIECTVTPLGLVLLCKSFSPFAIVAATADSDEANTAKSVIVSNNFGGVATATELTDKEVGNMFRVDKDGSKVVSVNAHEGYEIASIMLNGEAMADAVGKTAYSISLAYEHLSAKGVNFVEVKFVSKKILEKQAMNNESSVIVKQEVKQPVVTVAEASKSVTMDAGGELRLEPTLEVSGSTAYRWYKDGKLVENQTSSVLVIRNAQVSDSGTYVLKLTSASMFATYSAESEEMHVTINAVDPTNPADNSGLPTAAIVAIVVATSLIALCVVAAVIVVLKKKKAK